MIRFMQESAAFKKYALTAILIVICIAMAWYLVPAFSGQGLGVNNNDPIVATVSGADITTAEVRKASIQFIQQRNPSVASRAATFVPMVAKDITNQLISEKLMLAEARRLGLRATEADVREELEHGPYAATFFPGGKFIGMQAYEDLLASHDLTKETFEQSVADSVLMRKLQALIVGGATVTDAEVRDQFQKQNTKVKFDYAVLKKDDILKSIKPTDAELRAFYDRNKQSYVNSIPEKRQLKYVVLDNARMLAQTQVTQQELQDYYDKQREQYRVPEQVNVRHILIKTPLPGTDGKVDPKAVEAAQAKAQDVLKQVKAGGNFAELAKKYSDDPGSAKEGGALGWIGRGRTVPEFEKAAFSLPKGGTSDLVKSSYGFHIIHVEDKQDAHLKPLDEVKAQIEPLLKQQKAAQAAQSEADQLLSQARSSGSSLEKAAAAKGLQVVSTDFVTSKDTLPGIGADQQFMNAAFAQQPNAPPDSVQVHSGFAIYQVTAVKPPATPTFEEIRSRVEQEFKNERAAQLLTQKTQELSDRAKAEHDLKKAAKEASAEFKTGEFVAPDGQVPEIGSMTGAAAVAFTLKPGDISGPVDNGNTSAVLSVVDRQAPAEADFAAKKDQIREGLNRQKQSEVFGLFVANLHDSMQKSGKIKINQKQLDLLTKARGEEE